MERARPRVRVARPGPARRPLGAGPLLLAFSLGTFLAVLLALRHGMPMNPDAWAYWEGSVSLIDSRWRSLDGLPLGLWPVGYFAYLAACQELLGVSGRSLVVATALAAALSTAAWGLFVVRYARMRGEPATWTTLAWPLSWCSASLVILSMNLRAETVLHAVLPLVLVTALSLREARGGTDRLRRLALLGGLLALCVLLKHAALTFVLAVGWLLASPLIVRRPDRSWLRRVGVALALVLAVVMLWTVTTGRLSASGWVSFPMGFGLGRHSALEYLGQAVSSPGQKTMGDGLGQVLVALCCLAIWRADRGVRGAPGRRLLGLAGLSLLLLYAVFNLTYIHDPLAGRFTAFLSLMLVPMGLVDCHRVFPRRLALALVVLACGSAALRASRYMLSPRSSAPPRYTSSPYENFVPSALTLPHRARDPADPTLEQVQPLVFPWQNGPQGTRTDRGVPDAAFDDPAYTPSPVPMG